LRPGQFLTGNRNGFNVFQNGIDQGKSLHGRRCFCKGVAAENSVIRPGAVKTSGTVGQPFIIAHGAHDPGRKSAAADDEIQDREGMKIGVVFSGGELAADNRRLGNILFDKIHTGLRLLHRRGKIRRTVFRIPAAEILFDFLNGFFLCDVAADGKHDVVRQEETAVKRRQIIAFDFRKRCAGRKTSAGVLMIYQTGEFAHGQLLRVILDAPDFLKL